MHKLINIIIDSRRKIKNKINKAGHHALQRMTYLKVIARINIGHIKEVDLEFHRGNGRYTSQSGQIVSHDVSYMICPV